MLRRAYAGEGERGDLAAAARAASHREVGCEARGPRSATGSSTRAPRRPRRATKRGEATSPSRCSSSGSAGTTDPPWSCCRAAASSERHRGGRRSTATAVSGACANAPRREARRRRRAARARRSRTALAPAPRRRPPPARVARGRKPRRRQCARPVSTAGECEREAEERAGHQHLVVCIGEDERVRAGTPSPPGAARPEAAMSP